MFDVKTWTEEEIREDERYAPEREELRLGWEEACTGGTERKWYEKTLLEWVDTREVRRRLYGAAYKEQAYLDSLREYLLPGIRDEEYVEMLLKVELEHNIPAYVVLLTRDVLKRKLVLDRNDGSVKAMLNWCAKQVDGNPKTGLIFPNGREEPETGIQFFATSIVLTGTLKKQESISELEKSILLIAGNELIGQCVKNGILVVEQAQEYIDYAMSHGDRSILPALIALKYKEEQ